jgi:hypothetical protein
MGQDLIQPGFKAGRANTPLDQERPACTIAFYHEWERAQRVGQNHLIVPPARLAMDEYRPRSGRASESVKGW